MTEETSAAKSPLRMGKPSDYMKAGFFTAFGAVLLAVLAFVVWHVGDAMLAIILPFALGTAFALLLDPVVDWLERRHMRRWVAVLVVFGIFVIILVAIGIYGVPTLVGQIADLVDKGPQYVGNFQTTVNKFLTEHPKIMGIRLPKNAEALATDLTGRSTDVFRQVGTRFTTILVGSLTTLIDAIITLIITFYLLLDIDRLRARFFYLLPERFRAPMTQYMGDIAAVFSEYLRGLMIVSGLYGVSMMVLFLILGRWYPGIAGYALLIGVMGGLLYAVPYLGPIITGFVTFLLAFQSGGIVFAGVAVGIVLGLNIVFDNVLVPRIIGGGVGLHPVASIFALTLGGAMFGLWGLLLSVPVAASIQVILFRLFPKLTTPTPAAFLRAQGVSLEDTESVRVFAGDAPMVPDAEGGEKPSVSSSAEPGEG